MSKILLVLKTEGGGGALLGLSLMARSRRDGNISGWEYKVAIAVVQRRILLSAE